MARSQASVNEGCSIGKGVKRGNEEGGRYARYTQEQIEVLEKVYAECSNPNHLRRAQIMREQPILSGIDPNQLKVWFQNRRCREKQKKGNGDRMSENRRLVAAKMQLREVNDSLQKKVTQLLRKSWNSRNLASNQTLSTAISDINHQPEANNLEMPIGIADYNKGLLSQAEKARDEFLLKALGTVINWTPAPGIKLDGPCIAGAIYVPPPFIGVGARACVTVPFDPVKTLEILKDKPSWCQSCRSMDVNAKYPVHDIGTIELVYTQFYAPTIMACARDFWTLRYTNALPDGSFVVCEKSISNCDAAPTSPAALEFVRGKMLASGYVIRPFEGGSSLYLVDHLDLEASSVPELVQPLYMSSDLVVKELTLAALQYIEHTFNEKNRKQACSFRVDPTILRSSRRLHRGFHDAVNTISQDGWSSADTDASDGIIMSIKQMKDVEGYQNIDSVICAKSSLVLPNLLPSSLVKVLKERRFAWMDFNFSDHPLACSKAVCSAYPGPNFHLFSESVVSLGRSGHYDDEVLESVRFRSSSDNHNYAYSGDLYHLQVCLPHQVVLQFKFQIYSSSSNEVLSHRTRRHFDQCVALTRGIMDNAFGACSELIFSPIDRSMPNDVMFLSSGFRIFSLGSTTFTTDGQGTTSDEALNHITNAQASNMGTTSLVILVFQFPLEAHLQEPVLALARAYMRHVISSVKNLSLEIQSVPNPVINYPDGNLALGITTDETYSLNFADLIYQNYRAIFDVDLLGFNFLIMDTCGDQLQHHHYAILCFLLPPSRVFCLYANRAALNMLETKLDNLQTLTMDRILGGSKNLSLEAILPNLQRQGYSVLQAGRCLSLKKRCISYGCGVAWLVQSKNAFALALTDWAVD